MAQEMTERLVDRQGFLLGLSESIDIVQHPELVIAQLEIQLAAAAQFAAEQQQSPPAEEADIIIDHGLETGVGQCLEPGV